VQTENIKLILELSSKFACWYYWPLSIHLQVT